MSVSLAIICVSLYLECSIAMMGYSNVYEYIYAMQISRQKKVALFLCLLPIYPLLYLPAALVADIVSVIHMLLITIRKRK